jgi:hypothetical protein
VLGLLVWIIVLAALYNRFGKLFVGGDFLYAVSGGSLVLFGAIAVIPSHSLWDLPALTWVLFVIQLINHFYFNVINGGIKDVLTDSEAGLKTFATKYIVVNDGRMIVPPAFLVVTMVVSTTLIALVLVPFIFLDHPYYWWQLAALAVFSIRSFMLTLALLKTVEYSREKIAGLLLRREVLTAFMITTMLLALVGWQWVFLLTCLPLLNYGFVNFLMRGKSFSLNEDY